METANPYISTVAYNEIFSLHNDISITLDKHMVCRVVHRKVGMVAWDRRSKVREAMTLPGFALDGRKWKWHYVTRIVSKCWFTFYYIRINDIERCVWLVLILSDICYTRITIVIFVESWLCDCFSQTMILLWFLWYSNILTYVLSQASCVFKIPNSPSLVSKPVLDLCRKNDKSNRDLNHKVSWNIVAKIFVFITLAWMTW